MSFWEYCFEIAIVLFFVFLNAFFVAAEFAIVKIRSTQLEPLVQKGNWRARIAKDLITHLDVYLSATQLGITMTSLALGWVGEPYVAGMIEPVIRPIGVTNPHLVEAIAFTVGFTFITFLHIIVGEQAPKVLAIQKVVQTTLIISYPLKLFYLIFKPVIGLLNRLSNGLLRLLRIPTEEFELRHSEEELRLLVSQDKTVSVASRNIVMNAMDFRRKQARHVMVPRREVVALSIDAPAKESIEKMKVNKFSRYPVFKETIDNIVGLVHTKDIFKHERHLKPDFTIASVIRDAMVLPETATLEKLLEAMLLKKTHMVVLADEYGGTAGIITLENVLEELVGNIQDEFDRETPEVVKIKEDEYVVDGSLTTNDVERLINVELSPKDILSIGGFVIEQLGHIPQKGESLRTNGVEFVVEKVENNAVETLRVKKLPLPPVEETAGAEMQRKKRASRKRRLED